MTQKFSIRRMTENEVQIAIDWARQEGWNPGLQDAHCFYQADPEGFFLGLLNDEPIATGAAVTYGDHFAFCGLYIVKPGFRHQGYGIQLTEERLKYVGHRMTGLDGVLENVSKYEKIGYFPLYTNKRYALMTALSVPSAPQIVDLKKIPFKQLEEFDRNYFPAHRSHFLDCWIHQTNGEAVGYVEQGQLLGYGVFDLVLKDIKLVLYLRLLLRLLRLYLNRSVPTNKVPFI